MRFAVEIDGRRIDKEDFYYLTNEVGASDPETGYAKMGFDVDLPVGQKNDTPLASGKAEDSTLVVEWARTGTNIGVLKAEAKFAGALEVRSYFPWDFNGEWKEAGDGLSVLASSGESVLGSVRVLRSSGEPEEVGWVRDGAEMVCRRGVEPGDVVYVLAQSGTQGSVENDGPELTVETLEQVIGDAAGDYADRRVKTTGALSGVAEAITNTINWIAVLQPEQARLYTPAGRKWIFPAAEGNQHWTLFCWDAFFNGISLSLEAPNLARATFESVLETQYDNGNIPTWRGRFDGTPDRSQPPVGAFAVLKYFLRTGDRDFLRYAFGYLQRWSAWWREPKDGRPRRGGSVDGLFTWGMDVDQMIDSPAPWENKATRRQGAAWESGQDDLPSWDEAEWDPKTETLRMDAVDLNSYLVLDDECLGQIAELIGEDERADFYRLRALQHAELMNEKLWDEERGVYADWLWDGRLSPRLAASNFLPLIAGVPSRKRAKRMIDVLTDPALFWGEAIIPTISRDDPAFPEQQYWRGTVWPPMNFLVYEGLRRYGFHEEAAHLAKRSVALFMGSWNAHQLSRENFDSRNGEGGGQRHQSWGTLLPLMGVQELIDGTPWDGIRIGTSQVAASAGVENIRMADGVWNVSVSQNGFTVSIDGERVISADHSVIMYHVVFREGTLTADFECATTTLLHAFPDAAGSRWTVPENISQDPDGGVSFEPGTYQCTVCRLSDGE